MQACDDHGVGFLFRAQHDRYVQGGTDRLWSWMEQQPLLGHRALKIPAEPKRPARTAKLAIRGASASLDPPLRDDRFTTPRTVWVVYVTEEGVPQGVEPVEWMLLTTEPTRTEAEAWERVNWYTCRWIIEEFHKAQKSGCRLEASQLDDAEDIKCLAAIVSVTAVRLLRLRPLAHDAIQGTATAQDPAVLRQSVPWMWIVVVAWADKKNPADPTTLTPKEFWLRIARQGGYSGRRSDGRPGWSTIWKGWYDFTFMFHGAELMTRARTHPSCG